MFFISVIIALFVFFVWRKASKEKEQYTTLFIAFRTIFILLVTILVGLFYFKTCQVAVIRNSIQVIPFIKRCDSLGNITDTIKYIEIFNNFSSGGLYKAGFYDCRELKDSDFNGKGGVRFNLRSPSNPSYRIIRNDSLWKLYSLENIYKKNIIPLNDWIRSQTYSSKESISFGYYYGIRYTSSSIPSLIPYKPSFVFQGHGDWVVERTEEGVPVFFSNFVTDNLGKNEQLSPNNDRDNEKNGLIWVGEIAKKRGIQIDLEENFCENYVNHLNIFTAADVSQYSYIITVDSKVPIMEIKVKYNMPIEMKETENVSVGETYFTIVNDMAIDSLSANPHSRLFHVRLPALANLQLARTFILTALITALIGLLLTNLYKLFNCLIEPFRSRYKKMKEDNPRRVRVFNLTMLVYFVVIVMIIIYHFFFLLWDNYIHVSFWIYEKLWVGIALCIVIMLMFPFFLYKQLFKPLKEKTNQKETDGIPESSHKEHPKDGEDKGLVIANKGLTKVKQKRKKQ